MKTATVSDVMRMLAMLVGWNAKNGPDLTGEGRTEEDRAESEIRKTRKVAAAWHPLLDDLTADELFKAAQAHSRASQWFPNPAEIRAQVPRLKSGSLALEDSNPETGRDLWPKILDKLGAIGPRPDWLPVLAERIGGVDQERLGQAISDMGGWKTLRTASSDWERSQLGKRFRASWDRQVRASGLLPGGEQKVIDITGELARRRLEAARG